MDPDKLCEGCKDFFKEGLDYVVFEFVFLYLRRIKTDVVWKKLLRENMGDPIFKFITPSDIAYFVNHEEWKGNVGSEEAIGRYRWDESRRKNWTAVQCRGGKEENEWTESVEL